MVLEKDEIMDNPAENQEPKQNNQKNDQLFEEIQRDAGIQAIERVAEEHLNQILVVRERYSVDDMDLLTTNITAIKDIPQNVRDRMSSLQERIRVIIEQVAGKSKPANIVPLKARLLICSSRSMSAPGSPRLLVRKNGYRPPTARSRPRSMCSPI
jgi:CRISPR/Cas system CSM-associated protein Csm3 (group 7 of RAMP superfamily)